jgi:hypothetical protein
MIVVTSLTAGSSLERHHDELRRDAQIDLPHRLEPVLREKPVVPERLRVTEMALERALPLRSG